MFTRIAIRGRIRIVYMRRATRHGKRVSRGNLIALLGSVPLLVISSRRNSNDISLAIQEGSHSGILGLFFTY